MEHLNHPSDLDLYAEVEDLRRRNERLERQIAGVRSDNERLEAEMARLASSVLRATGHAQL